VTATEDLVSLLVQQDHFQAASVLYFRCRHAWNVILRGLHGSRPQVSPYQRIPLTATSGDNVVDEQQGSYPERFCRSTVMERTSRRKPHRQPGAVKARVASFQRTVMFGTAAYALIGNGDSRRGLKRRDDAAQAAAD